MFSDEKNKSFMQNDRQDDYPLKWHHFLSRFALWAYLAVCVWTAVLTIIGLRDSAFLERIYSSFPYLVTSAHAKAILLCHALLLVILSILSVVSGIGLLMKKRIGIVALCSLLILACADGIFVNLFLGLDQNLCNSVGEMFSFLALVVFPPLISFIVIMLLTIRYYKKRMKLFT